MIWHVTIDERGDEWVSLAHLYAKAAALVRKGWCVKDLAQDRYGRHTGPHAPDAAAWCAAGAIDRAGWNMEKGVSYRGVLEASLRFFEHLRAKDPDIQSIGVWNDTRARTGDRVARELLELAENQADGLLRRHGVDVGDLFVRAAARVGKGWTRFALARNGKGRECEAHNPAAKSWSVQGAVLAACDVWDDPDPTCWKSGLALLKLDLRVARKFSGFDDAGGWNDSLVDGKGKARALLAEIAEAR